MSSASLVPVNKLRDRSGAHRIEGSDFAIFGGTFDPFHAGHVQATRDLLAVFRRVIIAPTAKNPWKEIEPTPVDLRRAMVRLILNSEKIQLASSENDDGVLISEVDYVYAEELVREYSCRMSGRLFWAVGEDLADSVDKWRNWPLLGIKTVVVPITIPIHATVIRLGEVELHPAIVPFVKEHGLYSTLP